MTLHWQDLPPSSTALLRSWPAVALLEGPTVAKLLGVGPSTLRNWRHRGQGPEAEPSKLYGRGAPAPAYYRVSSILHWLDGPQAQQPWEYERDWLIRHFEGWRIGTADGGVYVSAAMSAEQTLSVATCVRQNASDTLFNLAASIPAWPGKQPRPRIQQSSLGANAKSALQVQAALSQSEQSPHSPAPHASRD